MTMAQYKKEIRKILISRGEWERNKRAVEELKTTEDANNFLAAIEDQETEEMFKKETR